MITTIDIAGRVGQVNAAIDEACGRVGRDPQTVTLIAVSKTHPAEAVAAAVAAGVRHFGENRVEESQSKVPQAGALVGETPLTWHMIGHLQSRKAKDAAPLYQVVHSIDTVKLAAKLAQAAIDQDGSIDVLLEMNVSGEASKSGFAAHGWASDAIVRDAVIGCARSIAALQGVRVRGLMTMAPVVEIQEDARPVFRSLADLRAVLADALGMSLPDLSMGMTDDYPVAIEEGATLIRVGRAIFGEREARILV